MAIATRNGSSLGDQLRAVREEALSVRGEAASIATELQQLVKMELDLAQAEMREARNHAAKGTIFGALALEFGMIMSVFLFLAIMFALSTAMPLWASALITTGIAALVAAIFILLARSEVTKLSPTPKRAFRTIQEDIQWARNLIRSSRT